MAGRIANEKFRSKVMSAADAAALIEPGSKIGFAGFTGSGYPKEFPVALAARIKEERAKGVDFRIDSFTGASTAPELDGELAGADGINFRTPYQSDPVLRNKINEGSTYYSDIHLSHLANQLAYGFFGDLDYAVIEATRINADGTVVPSSSVGMNRTYLSLAKHIIIEVNEWMSEGLEGMHDIYYDIADLPPNRKPLPIMTPSDRIGDPYYTIDTDKVVAVIETNGPDRNSPIKPLDEDSKKIAGYLLDFFDQEVKAGRLNEHLNPLQSGVGNIANAVLAGLLEGPFEGMTSYTEVIQDGMIDLLDSGKLTVASATAFSLSPEYAEKMNNNAADDAKKIILRPQDVSNHPEAIRRMGVIACNGMIEADIYGNVNSTHVMGSKMQNGIGGSGDFTRNAAFSCFVSPSTAKGGAISAIVPMVNHVDHTEHDVSVIITEQGLADLRGLAPRQRAKKVIENCAHPDYKDALLDYFEHAQKVANGQHTPHDLSTSLSWHTKFLAEGTMKP